MKKLIIFDMDGVLVDSEEAIAQASIESLSEWGVSAKLSDFKQFTGMGDDIFIGGVANIYGVEYDLKMKARAYEIYFEKAAERVAVYPWSKVMIEALSDVGYKLAVASASDRVKVLKNIECIGVDPEIFDALITGSDVKNKKPDPEIFLKAAKTAGEDPADCVVFEDALSGVKAAKAAGMTCIAVTTSFDEDKLYEVGADKVVADLRLALDDLKKERN